MKANKTMLIIGIICLVLCVISSLSLCIIYDLCNVTMERTFDWCVVMTGVCGVLGVTLTPFSFME